MLKVIHCLTEEQLADCFFTKVVKVDSFVKLRTLKGIMVKLENLN